MLRRLDITNVPFESACDFAHALTDGGRHDVDLREFSEVLTRHHHAATEKLIQQHKRGKRE